MSDRDRETAAVDSILQSVATLNPKTNTFELNNETMLNEVNDEWQFYTQTDKVYVKRAINRVKQAPPTQQPSAPLSSQPGQAKNPLVSSGPSKQSTSSAFVSIKQQQQNKSSSNLAGMVESNATESDITPTSRNWPSSANKISPSHYQQTVKPPVAKSQLTANRFSSTALQGASGSSSTGAESSSAVTNTSFADLSISSSDTSSLSTSLNTSSKTTTKLAQTATTTTTTPATTTSEKENHNHQSNNDLDLSGSSAASGGGQSASKKPKLASGSSQPRDRQAEIEISEQNECAKLVFSFLLLTFYLSSK